MAVAIDRYTRETELLALRLQEEELQAERDALLAQRLALAYACRSDDEDDVTEDEVEFVMEVGPEGVTAMDDDDVTELVQVNVQLEELQKKQGHLTALQLQEQAAAQDQAARDSRAVAEVLDEHERRHALIAMHDAAFAEIIQNCDNETWDALGDDLEDPLHLPPPRKLPRLAEEDQGAAAAHAAAAGHAAVASGSAAAAAAAAAAPAAGAGAAPKPAAGQSAAVAAAAATNATASRVTTRQQAQKQQQQERSAVPPAAAAARPMSAAGAAALARAAAAATAAAAPRPSTGPNAPGSDASAPSSDTRRVTRSAAKAAAKDVAAAPPAARAAATARASANAGPSSTKATRAAGAPAAAPASSAAAALPPPQAGPTIECSSCFDRFPPHAVSCAGADGAGTSTAAAGCGHYFCGPCMAQYVLGAVKDRKCPVPCPMAGAGGAGGCKQRLSRDAVMTALEKNPKEQQAFGMLEAEQAIPERLRTYCPHKSCSMPLQKPDDADAPQSGPTACPACSRAFCVRCRIPGWHHGYTCDQFQKLPAHLRSAEDAAMLRLSEAQQWKRCPQCSMVVERSAGCNHMRCRCGCNFCYACGERYRNAKPTAANAHGTPGCGCPLFDVPAEEGGAQANAGDVEDSDDPDFGEDSEDEETEEEEEEQEEGEEDWGYQGEEVEEGVAEEAEGYEQGEGDEGGVGYEHAEGYEDEGEEEEEEEDEEEEGPGAGYEGYPAVGGYEEEGEEEEDEYEGGDGYEDDGNGYGGGDSGGEYDEDEEGESDDDEDGGDGVYGGGGGYAVAAAQAVPWRGGRPVKRRRCRYGASMHHCPFGNRCWFWHEDEDGPL